MNKNVLVVEAVMVSMGKLLAAAAIMTGAGLLAGCEVEPGYGYGGYSAYRSPEYGGYYESSPYYGREYREHEEHEDREEHREHHGDRDDD